MKFKKQIFGFMDMLRFKKLVPNRREALASGPDTPLPKEYRTNQQAERLHPGYMEVELTKIRPLTDSMKEFTFRRVDSNAFPFFRHMGFLQTSRPSFVQTGRPSPSF